MGDIAEDQHSTMVAFSVEQLKPIARRNSLLLAIVLMFVWAGRQLLPTFGGLIAVHLTGARGSATTILADVTHPHERAGLIGIMDFSVSISAAAASLVGGWIYGLAGLGVLGLLGAALTVPPFLAGLRLYESKVGVYGVSSSPSRTVC